MGHTSISNAEPRPPRRRGQSRKRRVAKHNISDGNLPLAWRALLLDPEDYAHLDGALQNRLLPISNRFLQDEWDRLWAVVRGLGAEAELPAIYEAAFMRCDWVTDATAEPMAVVHGMRYMTEDGERRGDMELVSCGGGLGFRPVASGASSSKVTKSK